MVGNADAIICVGAIVNPSARPPQTENPPRGVLAAKLGQNWPPAQGRVEREWQPFFGFFPLPPKPRAPYTTPKSKRKTSIVALQNIAENLNGAKLRAAADFPARECDRPDGPAPAKSRGDPGN
jgi:hypothetical protein